MPVIEIPPYQAGPARLVTARSYLIDRSVPDCEIVALPAKEVAGGWLRYEIGPFRAEAAPRGRLARLRGRFGGQFGEAGQTRRISDRILFDFRHNSPDNWAHFLNNHLPIFFLLCEAAEVDWAETLILIPAGTGPHIHAAAALFGLELLATDDAVEGEGVSFAAEPWIGMIRPARFEWVRIPRVLKALECGMVDGAPLPRRVFLSRRETRTISNATEVEAMLAPHGFVTIYPEDLPAADQIRLFREAEEIVAIHGAALAPLLYVLPGGRLRRLVEILPVGHMTDVYRVMAEQVGVPWVGVRGRIRPAHVRPAYRLGALFDAFSLESFEVDPAALERAFALSDS